MDIDAEVLIRGVWMSWGGLAFSTARQANATKARTPSACFVPVPPSSYLANTSFAPLFFIPESLHACMGTPWLQRLMGVGLACVSTPTLLPLSCSGVGGCVRDRVDTEGVLGGGGGGPVNHPTAFLQRRGCDNYL